ncbi:MAG: glycogen debranching enzyme family protein [Pyrinomonadaceae bacterium]|nr:glycogen debranching enzyme family protein [Pyrinomonadaceae bacterium]
MISFDAYVCGDLKASTEREWLETNGIGGFASSTISGMNTRRYHALLVAALRPPTARYVLLSKLEETLVIDNHLFELSTNRYTPNVLHPQGFRLQTNFRLDPFPVFTFRVGNIELIKTIFMLYGENTIVARYELKTSEKFRISATLEVRPLVAFRDYHALRVENSEFDIQTTIESRLSRITAKDAEPLVLALAHDAAETTKTEVWYRQFEYGEEQERGFSYREDLFNPCALRFEIETGETRNIIASTREHDAGAAGEIEKAERARRRHITDGDAGGDVYRQQLLTAADQFIVRRRSPHYAGRSVIAGYHWFTDWGRDTMIALTGLTLATKRFDAAREILLAYANHIEGGLIPNYFPDAEGEPAYNTVDATLWFIHAAGELMRRTDGDFIRENIYEHLKEIIRCHERGTRYGIKLDADNLLRAGEAGVQLTWMDAKVEGFVVTPRAGKAVEIQALWYNALRTIELMAERFSDATWASHCAKLAEATRKSFNEHFWNDGENCLFDCIADDGQADRSVRPNQILAVSLPFSILDDEEKARRVVAKIEAELLTPYGLRSLSPKDKNYRPVYAGDAWARDTAYHQGTVWAWLMGPFITAYLKVHQRTPESISVAREWMQAFRLHLSVAGLGQISEIFDGDAPHTPRGTIAQAWSVAELLRCELEEFR